MNDWRSQKPQTAKIAGLVATRMSELGLKQTPLSQELSGHVKTIANLMGGNAPSPELLTKLAKRLNLEFYFGPPRASLANPSSTTAHELGPVEARAFETRVDDDGYVGLLIQTPEGPVKLVLPPDLSKDLGVSLTHRAMQIEEKA